MTEPKFEINPIIEKIIDTNKALAEKQKLDKDHLSSLLNQNDKILIGILQKPIRNITETVNYLRELLSISLKEAKSYTNALPRAILKCCTHDRAQEIKEKFERLGATIEVMLDERLIEGFKNE